MSDCRQYNRNRSRLIAYGAWDPWGDADQVHEHVVKLRRSGMSYSNIAEASGVSRGVIIAMNNRTRKGIQRRNANKILAVKPYDMRGGYVPADATRRMLRALTAWGVSMEKVANHTGLTCECLQYIRNGHGRSVYATTYYKVREAYDELSLQPPPKGRGPSVARSKARGKWPNPWQLEEDCLHLTDEDYDAEMVRRARKMTMEELARCETYYYTHGDITPLTVAGAQECRRRRRAGEAK